MFFNKDEMAILGKYFEGKVDDVERFLRNLDEKANEAFMSDDGWCEAWSTESADELHFKHGFDKKYQEPVELLIGYGELAFTLYNFEEE